MEIKDRFDAFIATKGLSRRKFQEKIEVSNSYIQNISKGISNDVMNRISIQYPELNREWLLTGKGDMIIKEETENKTMHYEGRGAKLVPHIEEHAASCGVPNGFSVAIRREDCEQYIIPDMPNCDFTIRTRGRSMINRECPERNINERDIVGCKIWTSRTHLRWGEVYALATNDGIVVKQIQESDKPGHIRCVSFNEPEGFKPYDLPLEEISDWAIVVGVVSVRSWA